VSKRKRVDFGKKRPRKKPALRQGAKINSQTKKKDQSPRSNVQHLRTSSERHPPRQKIASKNPIEETPNLESRNTLEPGRREKWGDVRLWMRATRGGDSTQQKEKENREILPLPSSKKKKQRKKNEAVPRKGKK